MQGPRGSETWCVFFPLDRPFKSLYYMHEFGDAG